MDWNSVIITLLSTTSLAGIAGFIVYYRENKKLKQNEVKVSNVEAQRQEMELAEMYKDKMLALLEQLSEKQESGNENQSKILEKLNALDERLDKVESRMGDVVTYLNGGFDDYLKKKRKAAKKQTPSLEVTKK